MTTPADWQFWSGEADSMRTAIATRVAAERVTSATRVRPPPGASAARWCCLPARRDAEPPDPIEIDMTLPGFRRLSELQLILPAPLT